MRFVCLENLLRFMNHVLFQSISDSDKLIVLILSKILDKNLKTDCEQFQVLCEKCYNLAQEYKQLQNRLIQIKNEIIIQHRGVQKTEVEDDHDYEETKEVVQNQAGNKENKVPKKLLCIPSSDDDSTQVKKNFIYLRLYLVYHFYAQMRTWK